MADVDVEMGDAAAATAATSSSTRKYGDLTALGGKKRFEVKKASSVKQTKHLQHPKSVLLRGAFASK
ncbi:hypothetical protein HK100_002133 [Physocladia obscura]|uniref:Uncharacterized protein n=1 Tax=Physocladia obscura TaxID=109957 RepID=A0AAD5XAG2_9FUNG|nr:hypothetical protein HK100_002133 [Physocladia obscura]